MVEQTRQFHELTPDAAWQLVQAAYLMPNDVVLEVGAGSGVLTEALLECGCVVHAVERDQSMAGRLREHFAPAIEADRLRVITHDAAVYQPLLPGPWSVVANPPFNLTSALVKQWLLADPPAGGSPPKRLTLLLQFEAAQKMTGMKQRWTRLSVLTRLFGVPGIDARLERDVVEPRSRVDLAIWRLDRSEHAATPEQLRLVDRLLAHAFAGPTSVRRALRTIATAKIIERNAQAFDYRPTDPVRLVPPPAWLAMAEYLQGLGRL